MVDYKDLTELDLKLHLLSGSSLCTDNLEIKPYTLNEMKEYGYTKYMQNIQWLLISLDEFIDSLEDNPKKEILLKSRDSLKTFDFYIKLGGRELKEILLTSLAMIFSTDDVKVLDEGVIAIGFEELGVIVTDFEGNQSVDTELLESLTEDEIRLVHRDNFDDIVEILKLQNYLKKPSIKKDELEEIPADEETRLLMEKMEANRKKVEKVKKQQKQNEDEDDADIYDIIDSVSSKANGINKLNIWNYTLYQVYAEYARLEVIDNYEFSIKAMMAGAKDVEINHWSSKV